MTDSRGEIDAAQRRQGRLPVAEAEFRAEAAVDEDKQIPAGGTVLRGHRHLPAVNAGVVTITDGGGCGDDDARALRLDGATSVLQQAEMVRDWFTRYLAPAQGRTEEASR